MKNLQLTYQHHEILMLNVVIGEYYLLKPFHFITNKNLIKLIHLFLKSSGPKFESLLPMHRFFKIGKKKKLQRKIFISIKFDNKLYNTLGHVLNVENGSSRPDFFKIVATLKQCSHKIIGH